ncbi:hypothetical protein EDD86DRAFT_203454 [Gorgonomyces haynaldii]|nr:hypothetical protein EDD86DRAFT_203454 [Gorgonomyces haynaldii]
MLREASSLIVCSQFQNHFKVLLMKRNARGSFGGLVVFPGGQLDPNDLDPYWSCVLKECKMEDSHYRIACLREAFEEAGLLLTEPKRQLDDLESWRLNVHKDASQYIALMRRLRAYPAINRLVYWANWITPVVAPKRFDTRFYLATVSENTRNSTRITKDGTETVDLFWETPQKTLELFEQQKIELFPPQYCILRELQSYTFDRLQEMIKTQKGPFVEPVLPELLDGYTLLPGDYMHSQTSEQDKKSKRVLRMERNKRGGMQKMDEIQWRSKI